MSFVPFIDTRDLPPDHRLEGDLCIIGSGAAGLTVASALAGTRHRVIVLESGGFERDPALQDLNGGKIVGEPYYDLRTAWLRQFGGTTNHWTAHVHSLDPIDFEARPWVPNSGWPFGHDAIVPFYERVDRLLELPPRPFDPTAWAGPGPARRPWAFPGEQLQSDVIQIVGANRRPLGRVLHDTMRDARNVTVYLHATVVEIVPDAAARQVHHLRVVGARGDAFVVQARHVVLATGGIENARLLLASRSIQPAGVGNDHDLVGRFFANHLEATVGRVCVAAATRAGGFYAPRGHPSGQVYALLRPTAARQRTDRLLNAHFQLASLDAPPELPRHGRSIVRVAANLERVEAGTRPQREPLSGHRLRVFAEQAPNRESRVMLGDDRDRLGQQRVVLDWRVDPTDRESAIRSCRVVQRELLAEGAGRTYVPAGLEERLRARTQSFHHMGTTRMHPDPTRGVVDAHCRVHGLANLHVAGSSVFPTYGTVNPTYTIIALAYRLADQLREALA